MRTRRPFFRSRPGTLLLWSTVVLVAVAGVIPFVPNAARLLFLPLSGALVLMLSLITLGYVAATGIAKPGFYNTTPATGSRP